MKNKREEDKMGSEESGSVSKRQRADEPSSASGIENPLVSYNDVDDEEEDFERRKRSNGGGVVEERNTEVLVEENVEDEEEDFYGQGNSLERRKSQFEPREDCPYLDIVNQQMYCPYCNYNDYPQSYNCVLEYPGDTESLKRPCLCIA